MSVNFLLRSEASEASDCETKEENAPEQMDKGVGRGEEDKKENQPAKRADLVNVI